MYNRTSYETEFTELLMHLKEKYGKKIFNLDGIGEQLDMCKFSKKFFSASTTADASVDANANVDDTSVVAYTKEIGKPYLRLNSYYVLWKELRRNYDTPFANMMIERQIAGEIYIHDLHGIGAGKAYCFNYSTYDIALEGLPMIKKIKSVAPKYLYSFKSQLEQFVGVACNSTEGATGLADMLIVMAHYVRKTIETLSDGGFSFCTEKDAWKYVRENLISFVYTINQPLFRMNESPFVNVSIYDDVFLDKLCPEYKFKGVPVEKHYVKKLQEMLVDILNDELDRTPITFPILTACFSVDKKNGNKIMDEAFLDFVAENDLKYGIINCYYGDTSELSSCCRLRSQSDNPYMNSFGVGASKLGSIGVVTINMPRLAWCHLENRKAIDKAVFLKEIAIAVKHCAYINNAKRKLIQRRIDNGNLPLYDLGFMALSKQYSTCGVNGLYECAEILGFDVLKNDGTEFIIEIINAINKTNDEMQKKFEAPHNCEQIPGEQSAVKLAKKDQVLKYNDGRYQMYSNQFIPLTAKADMLDRINIQGKFDKLFSGGAICHVNISERITDKEKLKELFRLCAKKGVVYMAINYVLGLCEQDHISVGKVKKCSICGGKIVDYLTRVVGFLTKVSNWVKERRELDFPDRQFYDDI